LSAELQRAQVAVIGAGPAGLALGWELQGRNVPFVILEKGEAGESWSRMPRALKLVSPWKWNWLTAELSEAFPANAQLTRAEFSDYLRHFAERHALPVRSGCAVTRIERQGEEFQLSTSHGEIRAALVVAASGYFSNPVQPRVPGDETTRIPRFHFANYGSAAELAHVTGANSSVLIVGKRLSAGQVALELSDAGFSVAISHRTPIRFGVDDWLWPLVYRNFAYAEAARLMCGWRGGPIDVRMPGGRVRKLIEHGHIKTFPAIAKFTETSVVFEEGQSFSPGAVLYATGFAPALDYLGALPVTRCSATNVPLTRNMESVSVPNLFFLGFEMLRNFQSRFLRGIRKDAVVLGDMIAARAATLPQPQRALSLV
jgi:putative flavoprotein involved in K+ transport